MADLKTSITDLEGFGRLLRGEMTLPSLRRPPATSTGGARGPRRTRPGGIDCPPGI